VPTQRRAREPRRSSSPRTSALTRPRRPARRGGAVEPPAQTPRRPRADPAGGRSSAGKPAAPAALPRRPRAPARGRNGATRKSAVAHRTTVSARILGERHPAAVVGWRATGSVARPAGQRLRSPRQTGAEQRRPRAAPATTRRQVPGPPARRFCPAATGARCCSSRRAARRPGRPRPGSERSRPCRQPQAPRQRRAVPPRRRGAGRSWQLPGRPVCGPAAPAQPALRPPARPRPPSIIPRARGPDAADPARLRRVRAARRLARWAPASWSALRPSGSGPRCWLLATIDTPTAARCGCWAGRSRGSRAASAALRLRSVGLVFAGTTSAGADAGRVGCRWRWPGARTGRRGRRRRWAAGDRGWGGGFRGRSAAGAAGGGGAGAGGRAGGTAAGRPTAHLDSAAAAGLVGSDVGAVGSGGCGAAGCHDPCSGAATACWCCATAR
jgi:hypothetical protein